MATNPMMMTMLMAPDDDCGITMMAVVVMTIMNDDVD